MQSLELRVPPPVVMLAAAALGWIAAAQLPVLGVAVPWRALFATLLALAGLTLNLQPKWTFRRAGTTVNPLTPTRTMHLVSTGLYRYTRNPMYLGHACLLVAWAVWLQNAGASLGVVAYALYIGRFQIQAEERYLSLRFPDEFAALQRQARRWL